MMNLNWTQRPLECPTFNEKVPGAVKLQQDGDRPKKGQKNAF